MIRFTRRLAVTAIAAAALAACGGSNADDATNTSGTSGDTGAPALQEMVRGDADAPITIIEYASWTCPACLDFDQRVMPMLKSEYIETGKAKLIFREFPTAPATVSVAGFAMARCAGPDKYYDVLDELFEKQTGILSLVRSGSDVKEALILIGQNHGIADEAAFDTCVENPDIRRTIAASIEAADAKGVNATPTIFINGVKAEGYEWRNPEGMKALLEEALNPAAGDDTAPAAESE
jgi:protein-disulfide isomerase